MALGPAGCSLTVDTQNSASMYYMGRNSGESSHGLSSIFPFFLSTSLLTDLANWRLFVSL